MHPNRRGFFKAAAASAIVLATDGVESSTARAASTVCTAPTAEALTPALSSQTAAVGNQLSIAAAIPVVLADGQIVSPQTKTVDLWWDLDPSQWWTALTERPVSASGGSTERVASVEVLGACWFSAAFTVPKATPGAYGVVGIAFDNSDGGVVSYAPAYVTVA